MARLPAFPHLLKGFRKSITNNWCLPSQPRFTHRTAGLVRRVSFSRVDVPNNFHLNFIGIVANGHGIRQKAQTAAANVWLLRAPCSHLASVLICACVTSVFNFRKCWVGRVGERERPDNQEKSLGGGSVIKATSLKR